MAVQWIVDSKQFYERMLALTERWKKVDKMYPAFRKEYEECILRCPQRYTLSHQYEWHTRYQLEEIMKQRAYNNRELLPWIVKSHQFYDRMTALTERWKDAESMGADNPRLFPHRDEQRELHRFIEKNLIRYPQHYTRSFQYKHRTPDKLK